MNNSLKRLLDVSLASIALIIFLPFLPLIILMLRFTGDGQVFFRQTRIGYKNKPFTIWKFCTMLKNNPNVPNSSLTVKNDPRLTRVGRFLCRTKINELPQLINVLKGEMSIVGPRPVMKCNFLAYPIEIQQRINNKKPGITGVASVVFRDEEQLMSESGLPTRQFYNEEIAPYKGLLGIWYLEHGTIVTDLKVIFITFWVIFFPKSQLLFKVLRGLPQSALFEKKSLIPKRTFSYKVKTA